MQEEVSSTQPSPVQKSLSFATSADRHAFWLAAIQEQATSGLSICAFCQSQGLPVSSFHHWKRTLAKRYAADAAFKEEPGCIQEAIKGAPSPLPSGTQTSGNPASTVCFAEVRLTEARGMHRHTGIEIQHGGFLLRLQPDCDRDLLRDLLGMLGSPPC